MSDAKQWVILLRHGIAQERGTAPEEERALTPRGRRRMRKAARGLARLLPPIDAIVTSPLRRAVETAHCVATHTNVSEIEWLDALRPESDPEAFLRFLRLSKSSTLVCAGHEPSLSRIAAAMLGIEDQPHLELRKGGCYVFTITAGVTRLQWMLAPRVLRSIR